MLSKQPLLIRTRTIRRVYNRALYLPERKKLMQDWADLLDTFKKQKAVRRAA
jgi:hypothetical protein